MGAITLPTNSSSLDAAQAELLHNATNVSDNTYSAAAAILVIFSLTVLFYALFALPWTFFRVLHAGWSTGWSLSTKSVVISPRVIIEGETDARPRRVGRLPLFIPRYVIPYLELSITQAFMLVSVAALLIFASFYNSDVIYDSTRTGYVAIALVPCVVMLGNKVGGVGTILQTGYASVNWMHRWLGRMLFVVTTIHVIAYFIIFARTQSMSLEMSKPANILACISYAGFCLIFFGSLGFVRRRWWHIFKIAHHAGIFFFVIGLNYHSKILRPWVGYTLAIIGFSVLLRMCTSRLHIAYIVPLPHSKSTVISLPSARNGWLPGQHVRIRVLTGGMGISGLLEAHPFTIATAPQLGGSDAPGVKLVVKVAGDWTQKLFDIAHKGQDAEKGAGRGRPVAVLIEGPYGGCSMVYSAFPSVLLAAGGSGVSYILGAAQGIINDAKQGKCCTRKLTIVWSVRDHDAVTDLKPYFEALLDSARAVPTLSITINLYFTSVSRGLIIRPMSLFPTAALLNYAPPSSPTSAASSQATLAGDDDPEKSIRSSLPFLEDDLKFKSKPRSFIDTAIRSSWRKSSYPVAPPSSPDDPFSDAARAKNVVEVKGGRPDFTQILQEVCAMAKKFGPRVGNTIDHGVAVGACGPAGMVRGLQKQCGALEDVEFHAEQFSL